MASLRSDSSAHRIHSRDLARCRDGLGNHRSVVVDRMDAAHPRCSPCVARTWHGLAGHRSCPFLSQRIIRAVTYRSPHQGWADHQGVQSIARPGFAGDLIQCNLDRTRATTAVHGTQPQIPRLQFHRRAFGPRPWHIRQTQNGACAGVMLVLSASTGTANASAAPAGSLTQQSTSGWPRCC